MFLRFLGIGTVALLTTQGAWAGLQSDPACLSQCSATYNACLPSCHQLFACSCVTAYQQCTSSCPLVCVEPKSVTTLTKTDLVSVLLNAGQRCLSSSSGVFTFQLSKQTYADSQIRRTEHCDGTLSDQVLSVSYRTVTGCLSTGVQCFVVEGTTSSVCK